MFLTDLFLANFKFRFGSHSLLNLSLHMFGNRPTPPARPFAGGMLFRATSPSPTISVCTQFSISIFSASSSPARCRQLASALRSRRISLSATSFDAEFFIVRTRVAYVSEFCVSSRLPSLGETLTNISVFALPPRESAIGNEKGQSRVGECGCTVLGDGWTNSHQLRDKTVRM